MASKNEATLPPTRRIRRSLGAAHQLNKAADKENATIAVDSTLAANRKKSRSKSMGPGGLDALKQGSGNRRAVSIPLNESVRERTHFDSTKVACSAFQGASIDSETHDQPVTRDPTDEGESK